MTDEIAEFIKYRWHAGDGISEVRLYVRWKFKVTLTFSQIHAIFLRLDKETRTPLLLRGEP